jgi:hypothetical protein
MKKQWPVVVLFAVLAAAWLATAYLGVTYKAKFRPNYKNYQTYQPPPSGAH